MRTLYAFNPLRTAVLLIAGDKTGDDRWYDKFVPVADRLFEEHLNELKKEGKSLMPTHNFRELLDAMPVARQQRIEKRFRKSLAAMLDQLRKAQQMTQLFLARSWGSTRARFPKSSIAPTFVSAHSPTMWKLSEGGWKYGLFSKIEKCGSPNSRTLHSKSRERVQITERPELR